MSNEARRDGTATETRTAGATAEVKHAVATGRPIAVVLTWVHIRNAEYEVVQRLRRAAARLGVELLVIDNEGFVLWTSAGGASAERRRVGPDEVEFVVSLHYESPKLYDVFSYAALWNPPEFYEMGGYARAVSLLASHDAVLSCDSAVADAHARNVFAGVGRTLEAELPHLFHSVPGPLLEPTVSAASRLFYVGINWERVTGERGRHQDLLERLDADDLLDIYGPRRFLGREPWAGFACYREEIPFDGASVVERINRSGICLALSSEAHQRSGIMSNRLFEGLAAGAVIIANPHPFIARHFADCVHVVDDTRGPARLADDVRALLGRIRRDPAEARARALAGQRRFSERFTLEGCLAALIAGHPARVARARDAIAVHEIAVVLDYPGLDLAVLGDMMATVARQRGCRIDVAIVCDAALAARLTPADIAARLGPVRSVRIHPAALATVRDELDAAAVRTAPNGTAIAEALGAATAPFFAILQADDDWFADHLATLADRLAREKESPLACSGTITEDRGDDGMPHRHFAELTFARLPDLLHCALPRETGRFLFRRTLLDTARTDMFALLDGFHARALMVEATLVGPLAQSGRATFVHRRWRVAELDSFTPELQQAALVLDAYRGDARWLARTASMPAAAISAASVAATRRAAARAETGVLYGCEAEGDGAAFLVRGFSHGEAGFTWVDGRHARIDLRAAGEIAGQDVLLHVAGRNAADGASQVVAVDCNGQRVLERPVGEDWDEIRVRVPEGTGGASVRRASLLLSLRHADPVRESNGAVLDARRLGLRVAAVGLFAPLPPAPAVVPVRPAPEDVPLSPAPDAPPAPPTPPPSDLRLPPRLRTAIGRLPGARRARRAALRLLARP